MSIPINYFARELDAILRDHQTVGLGVLETRPRDYPIHPWIIQRLKGSLNPEKFAQRFPQKTFIYPTLGPEALAQVIKEFTLSPSEIVRLKAALLTSFIVVKLIARNRNGAVQVAERLFPILVRFIEEEGGFPEMLESGFVSMTEDNFEELFAPVLWRYDQALLALHTLATEMVNDEEKISSARQAYHLLHQALMDLYLFPQTEQWHALKVVLQESKKQASDFLSGLGIDP